jgi:hypothetical protein
MRVTGNSVTNHDEHITARVRAIISSTPSDDENSEKEAVLWEKQ